MNIEQFFARTDFVQLYFLTFWGIYIGKVVFLYTKWTLLTYIREVHQSKGGK